MTTLRRTLSTYDLTLLVIGNVIGSGIFLVPPEVLNQAGSVRVALLAWLLGGVLSLFGALSYGELGAMDRSSGGLYAFIREAFGRFPAFVYGWTLFFVIGSGTIATLAVATAGYMGQFADLTPLARKIIAVLIIVIMTTINVRGTRQSASVQNWATWIKVTAILAMSAVLLTMGHGGEAASEPFVGASSGSMVSAMGLAMISVLWAYEGWQYVTFSAGEALEPQRSLPRAIAFGTLALVAIYMLANWAYLAALGPAGVAASERVAGDATAAVLGPWAGRAIAVAIIISMYSAAHATVITSPRVYYTMARDGTFFAKLAEVHPRFGTPAFAIIASSLWTMVLAWSGTFEQLLTYVVFVGWIFYALGAAAVIVMRFKRPDVERPFKVPGYPLTPLLFVLAAIALVGNTVVTQPGRAAIGLGVVLLSSPAYWIWARRRVTDSR
ncbi:MAG: amino acid permease [Gemmatimonadetes bacterium]|nr:amino acid permease [Gemmatimonadota bacterium]